MTQLENSLEHNVIGARAPCIGGIHEYVYRMVSKPPLEVKNHTVGGNPLSKPDRK